MTNLGIVVNRQLPSLANLSEATFLERVAKVQAIRTQKVTVSLFISDARCMRQLEALHTAVHAEKFSADQLNDFELAPSYVPFVLEMPQPLYQWLAVHPLEAVKAHLVNWMAGLYAAHCRRDAMWRKLLPDIKRWAGAYYSPYVARRTNELTAEWAQQFLQARRFAGGSANGVLENPFSDNERPFLDSEMVIESFRFPVRVGYFREDDWLFIVERDQQKLLKLYKSNLDCGIWTPHTIDEQMRSIAANPTMGDTAKSDLWEAWRRHFRQEPLPVLC